MYLSHSEKVQPLPCLRQTWQDHGRVWQASRHMTSPSQTGQTDRSWPPLWSIGLAVAIMLIVPFILYSIAPEGPIREGDTVFANGRHKVALADPAPYRQAGYDRSCVIEPRDPLVVLHRPSDGTILAQVQGKTKLEFPFCPPQAEIVVTPQQVFQKPDLLSDLKDSLVELFAR